MASTSKQAAPAATNVVRFPHSPTAQLRRELNYCHSHRMLDRWTDRLKAARGALPAEDYRDLVIRSTTKHAEIGFAALALTEGR